MNVVGITENGNDFCHAVLRQHNKLDPEFAAQIRKIHGWERMDDDSLLETQTFVSWYQSSHPKASIEDAVNNESYAWQGMSLLSDKDGEWGEESAEDD